MTRAWAIIRACWYSDVATVRALVEGEVGGTPYAALPRYHLALALERETRESRLLVADRAGEVVGLIVYGEVAGAVGAGRLHLIVVTAGARLNGIGGALCGAALDDLTSRGVRFVIAEVPDEPMLASGRALLDRSGFVEEARVADYYRDGVAMVILRRDCSSGR